MSKGCKEFLMEHSDAVVEVMMQRESNETAEHDLCYTKTGVCIEKASEPEDDTPVQEEM